MKARVVPFSDLQQAGRWRVELFTAREQQVTTRWKARPLGELVTESSEAILPEDYPSKSLFYIGLENVESVTGELTGVEARAKDSVKSRSKLFHTGQILYGRLRSYLRKAYLAKPPYAEGICSTEFIVLSPIRELVIPEFLRAVLVSEYATEEFRRFQIGAALPRISSKDLLSVKFALPPIEVQHEWLRSNLKKEEQFRAALQVVRAYPTELETSVAQLIKGEIVIPPPAAAA